MAELDSLLVVDKTVPNNVGVALLELAWPIVAALVKARDPYRFDEARDAAWLISMDRVTSAQRHRIDELAVPSLLLGASRLVPMKQTALMTRTLMQALLGLAVDLSIGVKSEIAGGANVKTSRLGSSPTSRCLATSWSRAECERALLIKEPVVEPAPQVSSRPCN
jgi:hypothetical protein